MILYLLLLQQQQRRHIDENQYEILPAGEIILSAVGVTGKTEMQLCTSLKDENTSAKSCLDIRIEEADVRIVIHIKHDAQDGIKPVVGISNDTKVFVGCLHYWPDSKESGLQELWF